MGQLGEDPCVPSRPRSAAWFAGIGAKGQVPASCATTGAISSIAVSKTTT